MEMLNSVVIETNRNDLLIWLKEGNREFSVRSLYKDIENSFEHHYGAENLVWKGIAPPKVECFGWLVLRQGLLPRFSFKAGESYLQVLVIFVLFVQHMLKQLII